MKTMYIIYFKFFFILVFFSILGSCQKRCSYVSLHKLNGWCLMG